MKKIIFIVSSFLFSLIFSVTVFAQPGQMGFFGGINEGTRLPKTTEVILAQTGNTKKATTSSLPYKELIFLSGRPVEFEGMLTVRTSGEPTSNIGTYRVTYTVSASDTTNEEITISRNITFTVNIRTEGNQIIRDYEASSWSEIIQVEGVTYAVDARQSHYSVSMLEDKAPGISYYKGDISQKSVYTSDSGKTTLESHGTLYGYESAWSNTETSRINYQIYTDEWQMEYQIRPSVSVSKTLQFSPNEPTLISFKGNYREVMSNKSGLQYDIYMLPRHAYGTPLKGSTDISTYNTFEQLTAPDTSYLAGNLAEADVAKLFALSVLSGEPKNYQPSQAITRGQYVTMLVKAVKIPIETLPKTTKKNTIMVTFPDVPSDRPDYAYIMAAYKSGLAIGRGNGMFAVDSMVQREEAICLLVRTLGLERLGLDPTPVTPFVDDAQISDWAKKEIYAAYRIGLIFPDENGKFSPKTNISKAEAAALVNRLIGYMRSEFQTDYTELIVNFPD